MASEKLQFFATVLLLVLTAAPQETQNPAPPVAPPPGLTIEELDNMKGLPGGLTALPSPPIPAGNPQTEAKIELGQMLFLDRRLSEDNSISCASCHDPSKGYSDGRARGVGITRTTLSRRTPSLLNSAYSPVLFWDGRAKSLEQQALVPMFGKNEMGMQSPRTLLITIQAAPEYRRRFREAFGREINLQDIQRAIAAFERTLVTPDSAFDRYVGGDKQALTGQQKRGLILFIGKAACTECHNGPNFSDNKFHQLGLLPGQREEADLGHFAVTKNPADRHAFKTPSLRSATQESHFMHNGSIASLAQVIRFYDDGGGEGPKSKLLFKLHLTDSEQADLLAFLHALAGHVPEHVYVTREN